LNEILCFIVIVQSSMSLNPLICYYDICDVLLFEVPKENHTPRVLLSYSVKHLHYACVSIVGMFKDKHPIKVNIQC